jgi:hypothetical protein
MNKFNRVLLALPLVMICERAQHALSLSEKCSEAQHIVAIKDDWE